MKQRNYSKIKFFNYTIAMIFAFVYAILNLTVVIRTINQEHSILTTIDSLILGLILLTASSFVFKSLNCVVKIDDDEVRQLLYGKTRRLIKWNELVEYGEGYVYTTNGKKKRFYLSKEHLSKEEIDNLALANRKCIYFNGFNDEFAKEIEKHIECDLTDWLWKNREE